MKTKSKILIAAIFSIALAICMPGFAQAETLNLTVGSTTVDKQAAVVTPKRASLAKFRSGAAGKVYAAAVGIDGVAGYQFQIAKDKRFKVVVRDRLVTGKTTATFRSLIGKKKYFARVRAYTVVNHKKVWGSWSTVKSTRVTQAVIGVVHLPGQREQSTKKWIRKGGVKAVDITSINADPAKYDGLVVPGGGDVDPALYGQKRDEHDYGINRKLDLLEIKLILKFAEAGKPVIGLCRGTQIINVAFGGTLCQHISGWHTRYRKVKIAKGSWLNGMFGRVENTYHYHHQCVQKLGKGIKATQRDIKDGHIEAIEHVEYPVYGLQWHPEYMGTRGARVARSFASICSKYSTPRKATNG